MEGKDTTVVVNDTQSESLSIIRDSQIPRECQNETIMEGDQEEENSQDRCCQGPIKVGDNIERNSSLRSIPSVIDTSTSNVASGVVREDRPKQLNVQANDAHVDDDGDCTAISSVSDSCMRHERLANDDDALLHDTKERYRRQIATCMHCDESHTPVTPPGNGGNRARHTATTNVLYPTIDSIMRISDPSSLTRISWSEHNSSSDKKLQILSGVCKAAQDASQEQLDNSSLLKVKCDQGFGLPSNNNIGLTRKMMETFFASHDKTIQYSGRLPMAELVVETDDEVSSHAYETSSHCTTSQELYLSSIASPELAMVIPEPLLAIVHATPAEPASSGKKRCQTRMFLAFCFLILLGAIICAVFSSLYTSLSVQKRRQNPATSSSLAPVNTTESPSSYPITRPPTSEPTTLWEHPSMDWVQQGHDIVSLLDEDELPHRLGTAVAVSENGMIVAVSAPGSRNNTGHVQVHEWDSAQHVWILHGQILTGLQEQDQFGFSLDISNDGSVLAVGAIGHNDTGSVHVYQWSPQSLEWEQKGSILQGDLSVHNGNFGRSLSLSGNDGNALAVGATRFLVDDSQIREVLSASYVPQDGYARVYDFNETTKDWVQRGSNLPGRPFGLGGRDTKMMSHGNEIGTSIDLCDNGSKVVVGIPSQIGFAGGTVTYEFNPSKQEWESVAVKRHRSMRRRHLGSTWALGDLLGVDVAISGNGQHTCGLSASGCLFMENYVDSKNYIQTDLKGLDVSTYLADDNPDHNRTAAFYDGSVSMAQTPDSNRLVIGFGGYDRLNPSVSPGAVVIHSYMPKYYSKVGEWNLIGSTLVGSRPGDRFGSAIAVSEDAMTVVVGASQGNTFNHLSSTRKDNLFSGENFGGYVRIFSASLGVN